MNNYIFYDLEGGRLATITGESLEIYGGDLQEFFQVVETKVDKTGGTLSRIKGMVNSSIVGYVEVVEIKEAK